MDVVVIGRYPPPLDGQSIATARLSDLLSSRVDVRRVDLQPQDWTARRQTGLTLRRALHFFRLKGLLHTRFNVDESAIAVWPAVSPDLAGHVRDSLVVVPALTRFTRVVAVVHRGNFDKLFRSRATQHTGRRLVDRVSRFVFLTHDLSERCAQWIASSKRSVIPNTIDSDVLFSSREVAALESERLKQRPFSVLFVSNMIRSKGYMEMLRAAHILQERGASVSVKFAGAWPNDTEKGEFDRTVDELRLGSVEHLGPIRDRSQLKELYRHVQAVALPTYYENEAQPLVLLEAMNAGIPVISTRHAGIPEMIDSGEEGFLVNKRDPSAIADAVIPMLHDATWTNLSRAARRRFERDFAPDRVINQWMSLLE